MKCMGPGVIVWCGDLELAVHVMHENGSRRPPGSSGDETSFHWLLLQFPAKRAHILRPFGSWIEWCCGRTSMTKRFWYWCWCC